MRISQAVGIAAIILIQLLVGGCKPLVQWELKEHLGSKPYADTLQTAEKENWQALDAIKTPQILVDIPAREAVPIIKNGLNYAISSASIKGAWKIAPEDDSTITFKAHSIQASFLTFQIRLGEALLSD